MNNRNGHRTIASGSQLSIEVSDLTKTHNGRLEITCLATIPAHVAQGEQFADYKTFSVKGECFDRKFIFNLMLFSSNEILPKKCLILKKNGIFPNTGHEFSALHGITFIRIISILTKDFTSTLMIVNIIT